MLTHISTLIVKVTHRCNLDCLYCYENITKQGEDMSLPTFAHLAKRVLQESQKHEITFLFHGGEPLLLPNRWYEEAIETAQNLAYEYQKKVKFTMQTNLLGLTEAKIELLQKYNISVGVSFDGVMEDTMRGGEAKVLQNFLRLRQARISAGILTTINAQNYQHFDKICHFLHKQIGIRTFKANVVTPVGAGYTMEALEASQIFEAQHAIIEYMLQTEGRALIESNLLREIQRYFMTEAQRLREPTTLCHEKRCGAGSSVVGITPQGDITPCGRFAWNESQYFLGNIRQEENLTYQTEVNRFHALVPQNWYDCHDCSAKRICGFGCQAFIVRSHTKANVDCLPTKMRYAYYEAHKDQLQKVFRTFSK
jgi:uncharacterized protein